MGKRVRDSQELVCGAALTLEHCVGREKGTLVFKQCLRLGVRAVFLPARCSMCSVGKA